MSHVCQNVQNLDYQGAEDKVFFQIFKWGCVLVLIDANFGFYIEPWKDPDIWVRWQSKMRFE